MQNRFYAEEEGFRYSDGTNVLCESLYNGRLIPYLRTVIGRPRFQGESDPMGMKWVERLFARAPMEAFELSIDGQDLKSHWVLVDAKAKESAAETHAVVSLRHAVREVGVRVHTVIREGTGFIERWLEVENLSVQPMALSRVAPLAGLLFHITDRSQHGAVPQFELTEFPDVLQGYEGWVRRRPLGAGGSGVYSSRATNGRSGWGVPWFMVTEGSGGETFVGMLEWSANWQMDFYVHDMAGEDSVALCFSMYPDALAPLRVIAAGETVVSPVAHLGHLRTHEAVEKTHDYIRRISLPLDEKKALVGGGRIVDGDLDWLKREGGLAAEMGMEYFLIDAGWYGNWQAGWYDSTGDWAPTRLGASLDAAREIIHGLGMRFGLWMEPESMGEHSELRKAHPDWCMMRDGEKAAQGRMLDLAREEVREHVERETLKVLREQKPDFFKIDYNTCDVYQGGENLVEGFLENGQYRYVQALYGLFDRMVAEHPDLLIENCAGGGGRLDLGLLRRSHVSAMTDFSMLPRSILAINNLTHMIPPERLRFYYGHMPAYHHYGSLKTQLNVLMFTNPIFVGFGHDRDWMREEERETFKRYIGLYKDFVRPVLLECRMFHPDGMLAMNEKHERCRMECATKDGAKGFAGVFRLVAGEEDCRLRLRGVKPGVRYHVELLSSGAVFEVDGRSLINDGIAIFLSGALDSEVVLYRESVS